MRQYIIKAILSLFLILPIANFADEDPAERQIAELWTHEALFVSLGSYCGPAQFLHHCGMRKAAFPLDWVVSLDGETLIEMIEQDFLNFLNEAYYSAPFGSPPLHTSYHLEFRHDAYQAEEFMTKYRRRIERFRTLANYTGKVFFIRAALPLTAFNPRPYYLIQDDTEISDEYALRLYNALRNRFPNTNIGLIIINWEDNRSFEVERRLSDHILMVKADTFLPFHYFSTWISTFQEFLAKLLKEETFATIP